MLFTYLAFGHASESHVGLRHVLPTYLRDLKRFRRLDKARRVWFLLSYIPAALHTETQTLLVYIL